MRNLRFLALAFLFGLISAAAYADNPVIPFLTYQSTGDKEWSADKDGVGYVRSRIDSVLLSNLGSNNTYTANMVVGGLQTVVAPEQSAFLQSVTVTSNTANPCPCELRLFNANPTGSTTADHSTFSVVAADATKVGGFPHIQDCAQDGIWICQSQNQMIPFTVAATAAPYNLYVVLVSRLGVTLTGTDVNVRVRFVR